MTCYLCNDLGFIAPYQSASVPGRPIFIAHEARPKDHDHPVLPCPACKGRPKRWRRVAPAPPNAEALLKQWPSLWPDVIVEIQGWIAYNSHHEVRHSLPFFACGAPECRAARSVVRQMRFIKRVWFLAHA
jgi:hypothetical protein